MTVDQIMQELEGYGNESTKNIFRKHGAREPFFGVKVQDLKKIYKKIKKDHDLAMGLYATGNSDAMYLAGLIADETRMTREDLIQWADEAYWYMLSEYTVPWVAAESPHGWDLAVEWIESSEERFASAGWNCLANMATLKPDDELDLDHYSRLLNRVGQEVHGAMNRVRYTMNGFVIAVGSGIVSLTDKARSVAASIGKVSVEMGGTACKVPMASAYIQKVANRGSLGKKRKTARC